jgi:hypothetical protein
MPVPLPTISFFNTPWDFAVPRIIEPPREGWQTRTPVIKSARLSSGRAAAACLLEAQIRAADIVAQAERQARRLQNDGYREGLRLGAVAGMQPLLALLVRLDQMQAQFSRRVGEQIVASMGKLLQQGDVLESLLVAVLDDHPLPVGTELQIVLPAAASESLPSIQARCAASGLRAAVSVGQADAFSISWQGHRWETQIDAFAVQAFEEAEPPHLSREASCAIAAAALIEAASALQPLAVSLQSASEPEQMRYRQDG